LAGVETISSIAIQSDCCADLAIDWNIGKQGSGKKRDNNKITAQTHEHGLFQQPS